MKRLGLFVGTGIDYAVPLSHLVKIVPAGRCYPLPKLPAPVSGLVVADGQLIPQLDLSQVLPCAEFSGAAAYHVLVESECGVLALLAEQSCGIVAEQKGSLATTELPTVRGLAGEFQFQGKVFQILDIDSLAIGLIQESW